MSDSEIKAEDKTEDKPADTAPYLKKDKQAASNTEPAKSNVVIPLVLLLVSAIVIIATFYEDEYKDLVAQADSSVTDLIENTEAADTAAGTTEEIATNDVSATSNETGSDEPVAAEADSHAEKTVAAAEETVNEVADNKVAPAAAVSERLSGATISKAAATETSAENDAAPAAVTPNTEPAQSRRAPYQRPPAYANREAYEEARQKAMARAEAERKKHNEMMQQRRQAYEKEMQQRREKYEAFIKAYKEKREKLAETQKAIYQQFEKNRKEAMQKMKQMHEEIAEMHKQMNQMSLEARPQMQRAPQSQPEPAPQPEFRHNSAAPSQNTSIEEMTRI